MSYYQNQNTAKAAVQASSAVVDVAASENYTEYAALNWIMLAIGIIALIVATRYPESAKLVNDYKVIILVVLGLLIFQNVIAAWLKNRKKDSTAVKVLMPTTGLYALVLIIAIIICTCVLMLAVK